MRILPGDGVTSTALTNGQITLRGQDRADRFRCTPLAATMWFALRHNDGFVDLAVDALADVWQTDRDKVRTVMDAWSRKLIADGWLKTAQ
ncbi:hypothetical protein ACIGO6_38905 [Streptomyces sp. NPDC053750]|jgi:hypothetical protein|uniref:hypothetical protein n=1 Tax=Streptomyces sp. NPDC053750 TaxID=3365714 RepID=UPI0037D35A1B